MPTTLLAMADAAYGSSGLLNDGDAKNAVSVKLDPDAIVIDKAHLATLPIAEKKRGLSECLKHAMLQQPDGGGGNAPSVEECLGLLRCPDPDDGLLLSCVLRTITARALIAAAVNAGNGPAASLSSYGHLDVEPREAASCYRLSHGDAVLLGLMIEMSLAGLTDMAAELRGTVPFTPLADTIDDIDFDHDTMREAYRRSARPRFRVGDDRYRIIRLAHVGEFVRLGENTPVNFTEYSFRSIYDQAHRQLALARQIVRASAIPGVGGRHRAGR
jgi:3-dehydroquinate synthetase